MHGSMRRHLASGRVRRRGRRWASERPGAVHRGSWAEDRLRGRTVAEPGATGVPGKGMTRGGASADYAYKSASPRMPAWAC
eukprot:6438002-Prymnesium_polylepis.1